MIRNLAQLLLDRAERRPAARIGPADRPLRLDEAVALGRRLAGAFADAGLHPGSTAAMIGRNSTEFVLTWTALQLAGVETALINPGYPPELLTAMLQDLRPDAVVLPDGPAAERLVDVPHVDASGFGGARLVVDGIAVPVPDAVPDAPPGAGRAADDIAGYMHTSGTTGRPKFCAQSQEYFLRLGRFIADSLCLSERDTVLAPLPLFHINPLGYGVVGGLTGYSDVLTVERFSVTNFWETVRTSGSTVLVLHSPPAEILKRATTSDDAAGHRVRAMFFADEEFMRTFRVPLGLSCYGSTEAGGLSHVWTWRTDDHHEGPGPMSRYGGRARHDLEWQLDDDGQILVRGTRPGVLFSGYRVDGALDPAVDDAGWFATGDLGRTDPAGNLVFLERRAESIRVKGEFVPITYVEGMFGRIDGIDDVALAARPSELVDDEVLLYVSCADAVPLAEIRRVREGLAPFMRPAAVVRVDSVPRDSGVGKVRRRELADQDVLEEIAL